MNEAKDEPVACVEYIPCCTDQTCPKCKAATPPQRTWVGLTREEILEARWHNKSSYRFARVLEATLKGRNT